MSPATPAACMAAFEGALVSRDMDAALALLADDAVLFYSNGSTLQGKQAFSDTMTASWKIVTNYRFTASDVTWMAQSDSAAVAIYAFAWSGAAGGKDVSGSGRATRVFRRGANGWRVAHEHLSQGNWVPNA